MTKIDILKKALIMSCIFSITATCSAQILTAKEMKQYSTEIIRYTIPADKHADFEKAYTEAETCLKQSAYCMNYQVLHGEEEPDHYIVIIDWTSKEDHLNGFRKSDEFKAFFNLVKPFYNNIQEMEHYSLTKIRWKE